jgi:potassium channel subfamily K, other eukaryote
VVRIRQWWFASTAIPLLAATIGPLANVLSIAALVTSWRVQLQNDGVLPEGADAHGVGIPDPQWSVQPTHVLRTRFNTIVGN